MPLLIDGKRPKPKWLKNLPVGIPLFELQAYFIIETLKYFDGNRTKTAKALKISVRTVLIRINEFKHFGFKIPKPKNGIAKWK
jgi:transcriptional regulator with PAS, ATPase and Fis domain